MLTFDFEYFSDGKLTIGFPFLFFKYTSGKCEPPCTDLRGFDFVSIVLDFALSIFFVFFSHFVIKKFKKLIEKPI